MLFFVWKATSKTMDGPCRISQLVQGGSSILIVAICIPGALRRHESTAYRDNVMVHII